VRDGRRLKARYAPSRSRRFGAPNRLARSAPSRFAGRARLRARSPPFRAQAGPFGCARRGARSRAPARRSTPPRGARLSSAVRGQRFRLTPRLLDGERLPDLFRPHLPDEGVGF
jgi:hypothetical protein